MMPLPNPQIVELLTTNSSLEGLRILHLSDLHIHKNTSVSYIEKLVEICHTVPYDFVVITGDIIDCKATHICKQLLALNQLKNVFYVSGNHDLFYGIASLRAFLSNFTFLDNTFACISFKQHLISLVGISDRFSRFFNIKRDEQATKAILSQNPNTILLAHQPKDYTLALKTNTALFLCGHTHGGQIFPFHYFVKLFQPFVAGIFYKEKTTIYVNKGLGTWGIQFRYKANSEITLLHLVKK